MKNNNLTSFVLYALSALTFVAGVAAFNHFGLSHSFLSVYVPLAFFAVVGLDFYRTQVLEDGRSEVLAYARAGCNRPGVFGDAFGFVRVARIGETNHPNVSTATGGSNFADRFIAYLFIAPFILPARLYEQVKG